MKKKKLNDLSKIPTILTQSNPCNRIIVEEHKDRKVQKYEYEWICPIILRNRLDNINQKEGELMLLSVI